VQLLPCEQLVESVQEVKQAGTEGSQAKVWQSTTVPTPQWPRPSQKRVDVSVLVMALEQVAAAQTTDPSCWAQAPLPSHLPVWPQPMLPWFVHVPEGSLVPASTRVHVPSDVGWSALFGIAQLWHWEQVAEPQHTFSTQWPVPH